MAYVAEKALPVVDLELDALLANTKAVTPQVVVEEGRPKIQGEVPAVVLQNYAGTASDTISFKRNEDGTVETDSETAISDTVSDTDETPTQNDSSTDDTQHNETQKTSENEQGADQ